MSIHIDELRTQVDFVDGDALLTPAAMERIVSAVLRAMDERTRHERLHARDLDLRSIRDQQRAGWE